MTRVVVTGVGAVSACGIGAAALWNDARDGRSAVRSVDFPMLENQRVRSAAVMTVVDKSKLEAQAGHRMRDPVACYAIVAAREAVAQAGLAPENFGDRCGITIGSGLGGATTLDQNYMDFGIDKKKRLDPMSIPKIMANASASWVAMEFGATGPIYCPSSACSSGSQGIGLGYQLIKSGAIDLCLAGGAEACIVTGVFRAWELLRVMTADLNRPFSNDRNGMILGEGAGVFVLESLDSAQARGAEILCEIAGFSTNSDAGDLLRPNPDRAAACMQTALKDSGLSENEVGYVNAHGTGTVANDVNEVAALRQVFGEDLDGLAVSSTKPVHGHALGASGALEAAITMFALRDQIAPPTVNFTEVDPKIGLDPVANTARAIKTRVAMSNSLAFGGINASLLLKVFDD